MATRLVVTVFGLIASCGGLIWLLYIFGARMGELAGWAGAIATVATVLFAVFEIVRSRQDVAAERELAETRLREQVAENRRQQRAAEQAAKELQRNSFREDRREWTAERLVELLEAWDEYHRASKPPSDDPNDNTADVRYDQWKLRGQAKARVRALISALPPGYAVLAARIVGVPRLQTREGDELIALVSDPANVSSLNGQAARLEIEWNLQDELKRAIAGSAVEHIQQWMEINER